MHRKFRHILTGVCALAMIAGFAAPTRAQSNEVKEKPRMFTYLGNWDIPRAQWAEMEKSDAADQGVLDKALANGTIVGYGHDMNLVHQADGATHDEWWSSMSMAGLLNVLDQFYKSGSSTSPVLSSAIKHWDGIYVSRYYNWHSGSYKGAYTVAASYKLKADAPDDAIDTLCKTMIVPLMEKMLADGTILEYEIDTEAIHTEAPGTFWIVYVAANADGIDKHAAAVREAFKMNSLAGPAFDSMVDIAPHRDYLDLSTGTYK